MDPTREMVEEGRLLGGGIICRPCLLKSIYQRPLKIRLPFGNVSVTVQDPEGSDVMREGPDDCPGGCLAPGLGDQPGATLGRPWNGRVS